jgi:hypothetical protein
MRRRAFVRLTVAFGTWQVLLFAAPMQHQIRLLAAERGAPVLRVARGGKETAARIIRQKETVPSRPAPTQRSFGCFLPTPSGFFSTELG